jgi:hypothetical protein
MVRSAEGSGVGSVRDNHSKPNVTGMSTLVCGECRPRALYDQYERANGECGPGKAASEQENVGRSLPVSYPEPLRITD